MKRFLQAHNPAIPIHWQKHWPARGIALTACYFIDYSMRIWLAQCLGPEEAELEVEESS